MRGRDVEEGRKRHAEDSEAGRSARECGQLGPGQRIQLEDNDAPIPHSLVREAALQVFGREENSLATGVSVKCPSSLMAKGSRLTLNQYTLPSPAFFK